MTHEKAIQELELKIQGELMQGNTPLVEIYELAIEAFKKLERIERIVNAPEYVPQEVQIRYYAICEVLKDGNRKSNGNF